MDYNKREIPELTPEQKLILQLERKAIFSPCKTKEHLKLWIKRYLNLDMPDVIVCDDDLTHPPSNSCPMDVLWEVYSKALEGTDENFQTVLAYSCRDGFKTLSASIMELLCLFHLHRDVGHMAAIEAQASRAAQYVAKFLQHPLLKDFVEGNNKREIKILRYENINDGTVIPKSEWKELPPQEQANYIAHSNSLTIVIATLAGANGLHVSYMCLDELDLAPPGPVEEAKLIPSPGKVHGELPITFMTSTRKFAFGLVQQEIDKAEADPDNQLKIRHWNIIDVTQRCPPSRHLPDQPQEVIYYSERDLKHLDEKNYNLLAPEERTHYFRTEAFAGCAKCPIFVACKGRLATKQTCTSNLLKPIPHVIGTFKKVNPDIAKAQLLCWKPSAEGLIYPYFNRERHMLTAPEMAAQITGEIYPSTFTKADLIDLMIERNLEFHSGMDFGFTHAWAVVTAGRDGHRLFVFDVIAVAGLELMEKIEMFKSKLSFLNPTVYPDPAYPSDIKTFKRYGVKCKNFVKDVIGGIEAVRSKLMPGIGREPEIFFLKGDIGCEGLAKKLSQYHWKVDANDKITDIPEDDDMDAPDALRYMCQNLFGNKTRLAASVSPQISMNSKSEFINTVYGNSFRNEQILEPTSQNWLQNKIRELTGDSYLESGSRKGKRGSFIFDI